MNNLSILPNGTVLRDIYRIDRFLSSGGFGNTYAATNIEFDEQVAIKEFFLKGKTERDGDTSSVTVSNPENQQEFFLQLDKFKKEARRIRRLQNDHIIKVHDLFEENGTAYYVMDYIDGESLSDRMKRTDKPMTENEVLEILPQILEGLKSVHDISVWHMDLKPSNIMIDKNGKVTIIDFGASKHIEQGKSLTTSMAVGKTVAYCPPEQTQETLKNVGPWTDIYALGATLYNLLTRNIPPSFDVILDEKDKAFRFPTSVSDNLQKLIIWMMKPNRKERPQSIEEVLNYLSYNRISKRGNSSTRKEESEETILETNNRISNNSYYSSGEETIMEDEGTIIESNTFNRPDNNKRKGTDFIKPEKPKSYLLLGILCTVVCLPTGLVAIYYSIRADSLYFDKDYQGAEEAGLKAKNWVKYPAIIYVSLYLLMMIIIIILGETK